MIPSSVELKFKFATKILNLLLFLLELLFLLFLCWTGAVEFSFLLSSFSFEYEIVNCLPSRLSLFFCFIAAAALLGSLNLQNPTPFDLFVFLSNTILTSSTSPNFEKYSLRPFWLVLYDKFLINNSFHVSDEYDCLLLSLFSSSLSLSSSSLSSSFSSSISSSSSLSSSSFFVWFLFVFLVRNFVSFSGSSDSSSISFSLSFSSSSESEIK